MTLRTIANSRLTDGEKIDNLPTDTTTQLSEKADLDSPSFTGTPSAPTATGGDDSTQIATTAFVQNAVSGGSTNHNDLSSLQGGTTNEYYHLTSDQNDATAGTSGTPSTSNKFVTNDDSRNTDSRQCNNSFDDAGAQRTNLGLSDAATTTVASIRQGTTKSDVGLSNVDDTQQMPLSYLDTDGTLEANSDQKVASQKATKTYSDVLIRNGRYVPTKYAGLSTLTFNLTYTDDGNFLCQKEDEFVHMSFGTLGQSVRIDMSGFGSVSTIGECVKIGNYLYVLARDSSNNNDVYRVDLTTLQLVDPALNDVTGTVAQMTEQFISNPNAQLKMFQDGTNLIFQSDAGNQTDDKYRYAQISGTTLTSDQTLTLPNQPAPETAAFFSSSQCYIFDTNEETFVEYALPAGTQTRKIGYSGAGNGDNSIFLNYNGEAFNVDLGAAALIGNDGFIYFQKINLTF